MNDMPQTDANQVGQKQSMAEFIGLIALLISMVALTIDTMLPALPAIGSSLGVADANDTQFVVSLFFLGFAIGQLVYGPVSDSIGRKRAIMAGLLLFAFGCFLSLMSHDFETMLIGRILQGLGVAAPRTVTMAIVRDRYAGRGMARIMSFAMAVFILVPVVAPSIGQLILTVLNWHAIFIFLVVLGAIAATWMTLRLPETLAPENRMPLSFKRVGRAAIETCTNRAALGYTIAAGLILGAFIGYLTSSQQIFQDIYAVGEMFPIYFSVMALSIGVSSFLNARLVVRFGMRLLSFIALSAMVAISIVFLGIELSIGHDLPLWAFMVWGVGSFFWVGLLFGNLNALAMEPMGHIAGTASAVVGAGSTMLALIFGSLLGQAYNGTAQPMLAGFAVLGSLGIITMLVTNKGLKHGSIG